jgi:hypothetical protein
VTDYLWHFLLPGYLLTIAIETPILLIGLSRPHSLGRRLFAGIWLTACTYPIVVLVLPLLLQERWVYLLVAETFAPVAECALFAAAFHAGSNLQGSSRIRDLLVITLANLASFGIGLLLNWGNGQTAA